jgi:glycosyltransferase involved in cell wall biosynthesis
MRPNQGQSRVEVSVIVPVRDDPWIDDLLLSLASQKEAPPFEVLVALDGSRRAPRVPPHLSVRLVALPPRGAYAARNAAIQLAQGDILLLTDSDCVCPPDWIAASLRSFADASLIAMQDVGDPAQGRGLFKERRSDLPSLAMSRWGSACFHRFFRLVFSLHR